MAPAEEQGMRDSLSYEALPLHPGRFRLHELEDGIEIELVPRSARRQLPWITVTWILAILVPGLFWYWRVSGAEFIPSLRAAIMISIMSLPAAAGVTWMLISGDRQRLSLRADKSGLVITRTMMGMPDRQHFSLDRILDIGVPNDASEGAFKGQTIRVLTPLGDTHFLIMREPKYVQEICERLREVLQRHKANGRNE